MSGRYDKTISFRSQLSGDISDFLKDEGFECASTYSAVTAIISDLSHYKEEGTALSPEVYLCDDISQVARLVPGCSFIVIGEGSRNDETVLRALKECAPLAKNQWSIFIERNDKRFRYGVFAARDFPLSVTVSEVLIDSGENTIPAVMMSRVADNCVEARGARGNRRCIHFSSAREDSPSPREAVAALTKGITAGVHRDYEVQVERFLYLTLLSVFQESHGALVVVLGKRRRVLPRDMSDAIRIEKPIDVLSPVREYVRSRDHEAVAELQRIASLIDGMLRSDGITVFRSDASVLAYRAFLRHWNERKAPQRRGGARMRTFDRLKELVDTGNIEGAFVRSQDGYTQYYGRTQ
jgi:hypothetical protein